MKITLPKRPSYFRLKQRLRWNRLYKLSWMLLKLEFTLNEENQVVYPINKIGEF